MRPEVKEHLIYLRDALWRLPSDLWTVPLEPKFLVGPMDRSWEWFEWGVIFGHLRQLIAVLIQRDEVEQLDADVEEIGALLASRCKTSTPWTWTINDQGAMIVTTDKMSDAGLIFFWNMPFNASYEQARHALYRLMAVLLGASPREEAHGCPSP